MFVTLIEVIRVSILEGEKILSLFPPPLPSSTPTHILYCREIHDNAGAEKSFQYKRKYQPPKHLLKNIFAFHSMQRFSDDCLLRGGSSRAGERQRVMHGGKKGQEGKVMGKMKGMKSDNKKEMMWINERMRWR